MKRWLGMGLIGLALLIASCGGDKDNGADELSVSEYFNRVQEIGDETRDRAASLLAASFSEDVAGVADFFSESLDIWRNILNDYRDLNPPSEVQSAHNDIVSALDDFIDHSEDLVEQLGDLSTDAEFDFRPYGIRLRADDVDARYVSACEDLLIFAIVNNISFDLLCVPPRLVTQLPGIATSITALEMTFR